MKEMCHFLLDFILAAKYYNDPVNDNGRGTMSKI